MTQQTTSLALPAEVKPLKSVQEFNRFLEQFRDVAIILAPVTVLDYLPDVAMLSLRREWINPFVPKPNSVGEECYHNALFCNGDPTRDPQADVALGKVGLLKLMAAAGLSIVSTTRNDDRRDPHFAEFSVTVAGRDFDGQFRQTIGTRALNLRDGSDELKGFHSNQISAARRHIGRTAETKALETAIRMWLSLQQTYKVATLKAKPFIVPKLIPNPDHPAVSKHFIQSFMSPVSQLYGQTGPAPGEEVRTEANVEGRRLDAPADRRQLPSPAAPPREDPPADEPADEFDAELPDLTETPAEEVFVCKCPHGCERIISKEVAEATLKATGIMLCAEECYPSKSRGRDEKWLRKYAEDHLHLKTLGFKTAPNMTAEDMIKRLRASAGGK